MYNELDIPECSNKLQYDMINLTKAAEPWNMMRVHSILDNNEIQYVLLSINTATRRNSYLYVGMEICRLHGKT